MKSQKILAFLIVLTVLQLAFGGTEDRYIFRITNNSYEDSSPRISGSKVVWLSVLLSDQNIFMYNHDANQITKLTHPLNAGGPDISGNNVVWVENDGEGYQIMFYDGTTTTKLTNGYYENSGPKISGSNVVWELSNPDHDGEIVLYRHKPCPTVIQLTDDNFGDSLPDIYDTYIVWSRSDGNDSEIAFYDGFSMSFITDNNVDDSYPQVSYVDEAGLLVGPVVTWQWFDGNDSEISVAKYGKVWQITRLTDNSYEDENPQIDGSQVVWQGWDGHDYEIFSYNIISATTTQITNNNYDDRDPQVSGQNIVWQGFDGNDWEIFLYDGSSITQVTNNDYMDYGPQISGGNIVWMAEISFLNFEIFGYLPEICSPPLAGDLNGDCKINFTDFAIMASQWLVCNKQPQSLCD